MTPAPIDLEDDRELLHLLSAWCDGAISGEQRGRLEQLLRASDASLDRAVDYLDLHANLAAGSTAAALRKIRRPKPHRRTIRPTVIRFAAAAVVVLGIAAAIATLVGLAWQRRDRADPSAASVATLIDVHDAVFDGGAVPTPGHPLTAGFIRLRSGQATLEFYSGARVTLTGPCEFGLNSTMRGLLRSGSLRAECPPSARGFTIGAPGFSVVDLGTRFRLAVDPAKPARVEVEQGHVELRSSRGTVSLTTRQSARIDAAGQVAVIENEAKDPAAAAAFTGEVPLGALFDNSPWATLAYLAGHGVEGAAARAGVLGIERVVRGGEGAQVVEIAPGIRLDLTPLDWARSSGGRWPTNRGPGAAGVEMHANLLLTVDLAKFREAGPVAPTTPMRFVSERAGIDSPVGRGAPVQLLVIVSDGRRILTVAANGQASDAIESDGVWRLRTPLPEPLISNQNTVDFDVPLPPEARYLTLVSAAASTSVWNDHVVFRGARLIVGDPQPIDQGEEQ